MDHEIGDLYSNDRREYTLEMNIPEGAGLSVLRAGY